MSHHKINMLYLFQLLISTKCFGLKDYHQREYFIFVEKIKNFIIKDKRMVLFLTKSILSCLRRYINSLKIGYFKRAKNVIFLDI